MNCVETWNIWMRWCNDWNFVWVMPNDLVTLFKSWTGVMMKGGQIRLWKMAFYALVWSLWLFRNDIVFCGKVWDPNQLYKLTELRVATWANAKWPQENYAARGCQGEAGIGGILRNSNGEIRMIFSKSIGFADSNLAEMLAKREAFLMFSASQWCNTHTLVVEIDSRNRDVNGYPIIGYQWVPDLVLNPDKEERYSKVPNQLTSLSRNVVKWIQTPESVPWRLRRWTLHIEMLKNQWRRWEIKHILREANQQADNLAKTGIGL
ncbi:Uncharacterized protein TCM_019262 [Theobroma cacao]|uniref:RNase H type-1 domain-containing protein n=1 Tax=Theobroma cacao TaxID=3641 RepID=A0A061EG63_THECC|nr:Uncharacterized protein TCM_019262 [Theobroma cacao]